MRHEKNKDLFVVFMFLNYFNFFSIIVKYFSGLQSFVSEINYAPHKRSNISVADQNRSLKIEKERNRNGGS